MDFDAMMAELRQEYLADLPGVINNLKTAHSDANGEEVHRIFHQLKGSGKTYGFDEITELCKIMESSTKDNSIPDSCNDAISLLEAILEKRSSNETVNLNLDPRYIKLLQGQ